MCKHKIFYIRTNFFQNTKTKIVKNKLYKENGKGRKELPNNFEVYIHK